MFKYLVSVFTMKKQCVLFIDQVNGKEVYLWIDKYGAEYMAHSKFGFRVKRID